MQTIYQSLEVRFHVECRRGVYVRWAGSAGKSSVSDAMALDALRQPPHVHVSMLSSPDLFC